MGDMGMVVRAAGGPEAMEWTELDTAAPGPGKARIVQHAVGELIGPPCGGLDAKLAQHAGWKKSVGRPRIHKCGAFPRLGRTR